MSSSLDPPSSWDVGVPSSLEAFCGRRGMDTAIGPIGGFPDGRVLKEVKSYRKFDVSQRTDEIKFIYEMNAFSRENRAIKIKKDKRATPSS